MARNPKPERKWYKLVYGCTEAEHKRCVNLELKRIVNWRFNCEGTLSRAEFAIITNLLKG